MSAWNLSLPTPTAWPAFEFKRLETVKLGTLESILTDRPYDSLDQDQLHNVVRMGGPEGPWVSRVRPELVLALAGLSTDRAGAVAEAWADTDEFKARPTDSPDPQLVAGLAVLLPAMADFARTSIEGGTPVFLLMSL